MLALVRFEGVEHPWLWLLLVIAAGAILYVAYRGMFQRTSQRLAWWLMGLRGWAVAAAPGPGQADLDARERASGRRAGGGDRGYFAVDVAVRRHQRHALQPRETRAGATAARPGVPARPRLVVDLFDINGKPLTAGLPDAPTQNRTDLLLAISETRRQMRSRPLAGMVLISDGMDNTGRTSMRDLEDTSIAIHTLGFPETDKGDLDLAVRKPQVPERVLVHNKMRIEVPVSKVGKPAVDATVLLKRGSEELARETVKFAEGKGEQLVPLSFTPSQPGSFVYTVAVQTDAGERKKGNNAALFPLRVDAEPIRVLYLEGYPARRVQVPQGPPGGRPRPDRDRLGAAGHAGRARRPARRGHADRGSAEEYRHRHSRRHGGQLPRHERVPAAPEVARRQEPFAAGAGRLHLVWAGRLPQDAAG